MRPTGKRIAIGSGIIAAVVLGGAGIAFKDLAVEQWYIWKLQSERPQVRILAANALGVMQSKKAVVFLEKLRQQLIVKTTIGCNEYKIIVDYDEFFAVGQALQKIRGER